MATAKVTTVGGGLVIELPKDIAEKLHVGDGDEFYIVETPTGIQLTHRDKDFETTIEVARRIMREHDGTLRKLAK